MRPIEVFSIILAIILCTIQGTLVFRDAIKNRIPNPWLWGIIGLINVPSSGLVYFIYKKNYFKKKNKK